MVKRHGDSFGARSLFGVLVLAATSGLAWAAATRIGNLDDVVAVRGVQSDDHLVRGQVVNQTDDQLENVRLLVTDRFLWRNERHPGSESPSRTHEVLVPGPVPPHGSAQFELRRPSPLPERGDGRFVTDVSPVELVKRAVVPMADQSTTMNTTYERRRKWEGH